MIYCVGTREKELIVWGWGFDRTHGQLAQRSKSPARGQVKNRFPLFIREIMFFKIPDAGVCFDKQVTGGRGSANSLGI
jgi:hypothetical protein